MIPQTEVSFAPVLMRRLRAGADQLAQHTEALKSHTEALKEQTLSVDRLADVLERIAAGGFPMDLPEATFELDSLRLEGALERVLRKVGVGT